MTLMGQDDCAWMYPPPPEGYPGPVYAVKEDMLCAASRKTEKSICRGDSGGPLVCPVEGVWYLIGITSWSSGCESPVAPSVFANVTYFANWIEEKKQASPDPDIALAPPQEGAPALIALDSQDSVLESKSFGILMSSQIFLLQLTLLGNL
ncbi:serine protease 40-like [Octodon degus]|uniref:Serine protease 40-like n=1 Tax=Octodon degus TaxID=10160 RepID=A0A6P6DUT5_OCTDE|nr:serine protease 40-like [Octodon degus]